MRLIKETDFTKHPEILFAMPERIERIKQKFSKEAKEAYKTLEEDLQIIDHKVYTPTFM
jgi:hypothetical protein